MGQKKFVKKRHHYVWAHYIRNWAVENHIYYVSPKGRVAQANANALAAEKEFYRIHHLDDEDIKYIWGWIEKSEPGLKKLHWDFFQDFIVRAGLVKMASRLPESDDLRQASAAIEFNSLEDVHSNFESGARVVMDRLSAGSREVLSDDKSMMDLCSYLGHQLTRTKFFREKTLAAIRAKMSANVEHLRYLDLTEKNWWYVNFLQGLNAGWSFYSSRKNKRILFLVNNTDVGFITSDNPVINIHPSVELLSPGEAPVSMDLYFPISPKYAVMMNDSDSYVHMEGGVSIGDVGFLNKKVARSAYESIYGSQSDILKAMNWKPQTK